MNQIDYPAPPLNETPMIAAVGEPHLACVLLLDTSGSMSNSIGRLNEAINRFIDETSKDPIACKRVDVAIITFSDKPQMVCDFTPIEDLPHITLGVGGCTLMGPAIQWAVDKVKERNRFYAGLGIPCFKPWIFMMTDGYPYPDTGFAEAAQRVRDEEAKGSHGKLKFFALGVGDYQKEPLFKITDRVMELEDTNFSTIFDWLADSMVQISVSRVGEGVQLKQLPENARIVPDSWGA